MKYANIIGEEVMTMEFLEKMNLCEEAGWEHAKHSRDSKTHGFYMGIYGKIMGIYGDTLW